MRRFAGGCGPWRLAIGPAERYNVPPVDRGVIQELNMKRRMFVPGSMILRSSPVALSLVLLMAAGCERRKPNEAGGFDPQIDAMPSSLRVVVDSNVAANQERISADLLERRSPAQPEAEAPQADAGEEPDAAEQSAAARRPTRASPARSTRTRRP